jgi:hypothetical protein
MLIREQDQLGITTYIVCNGRGEMLIRTTNSKIAYFIEYHVRQGVDPALRLRIGGDRGAEIQGPVWMHVRRFNRR